MADVQPLLLTDLLKEVSRSFYLTLRVLPKGVRPQIGLAYLLARTTDTVADTTLLPATDRLHALEALRQRIAGLAHDPLPFAAFIDKQRDSAERAVLARVSESLALLEAMPEPDRRLIRDVLAVIISGQALDLRRFSKASKNQIAALPTADDLDDYTYRVAGCVGEFWTAICLQHLFRRTPEEARFLHGNGVRFGKGLQLVNILRDLPADLRQGRCYLPADELAAAGLQPADLLDPQNEVTFRPVYDRFLALGEEHLAAGWAYTNALPGKAMRVRLACAWPVLIGLRTLRLLRQTPVLNPANRVKVSRREVKGIMVRSVLYYPFPRLWNGLVRTSARQ